MYLCLGAYHTSVLRAYLCELMNNNHHHKQHYKEVVIYHLTHILPPPQSKPQKISPNTSTVKTAPLLSTHIWQYSSYYSMEFRLIEFNVVKLVALLICTQEDLGLNHGQQIGWPDSHFCATPLFLQANARTVWYLTLGQNYCLLHPSISFNKICSFNW